MLSAAHLGAELESIQWTFQGKMNSWTFQGQLRLPLKQTLRRGRENERERGESVPVTHCAACVSHSSLWPVSQLLWSLPNSPRKNNPEREKRRREENGSSHVFSRLAGNELRAARKRYAGHSLEPREWRGSYASWGQYEGAWLLSCALDGSVDRWSSHTAGVLLFCASHLQPRGPPERKTARSYQLCARHIDAHGNLYLFNWDSL